MATITRTQHTLLRRHLSASTMRPFDPFDRSCRARSLRSVRWLAGTPLPMSSQAACSASSSSSSHICVHIFEHKYPRVTGITVLHNIRIHNRVRGFNWRPKWGRTQATPRHAKPRTHAYVCTCMRVDSLFMAYAAQAQTLLYYVDFKLRLLGQFASI